MKLIVAGQNFWIQGGADRVLMDHIAILEERGHVCAPFAAQHEKNLPTPWSRFFPKGANIKSPKPGDVAAFVYSLRSKKAIAALLDELKPDVVHCHIYYGSLTSSILSEVKRRNIPLIQTLHEYKIVCPVYTNVLHGESCNRCSGFKFYNALVNRCNRGSLARSAVSMLESYVSYANGAVSAFDKFVTVSDFLRNKVISMGVPADKVVTVYNPIDTEKIQPSAQHDGYFLYYGRIELDKGVMVLLEAMRALPQLRLHMVGTGAALPQVQQYIAEHGMSHVSCLGYMSGEALAAQIRNTYCTIVPSVWDETFGLTAAESMAYGKPVIASRIGGLPEVVDHQVNGLLVEPKSVDSLRQAIEYMHAHPQVAAAMALAARDKVVTRFSRDIYYRNMLNVYREFVPSITEADAA